MTSLSAPQDSAPRLCAGCGAAVTGRFCGQCGADASPRQCGACRADLAPGGRFCHRCGTAIRAGTSTRDRAVWLVAGASVAVAVTAIVYLLAKNPSPAPAPVMANPGSGTTSPLSGRAPDISGFTPRERFERLFQRVMTAAERGDTAAAVQFTDHALSAYTQLDSVDADARYQAALLRAQVGQFDAALALADTILTQEPTHLFGFVIRGKVAELRRDTAALRAARNAFLQVYDAERTRDRSGYVDHAPALDDFRKAAAAARPLLQ